MEPNLPVWTLFILWGNVDLSQHLGSSDYFQFKFITLFTLILTSSLWAQSHPVSRNQQSPQRHKVLQKNGFQQAYEKQILPPYRDSLGDHRVASLLLSILGHQLVSNWRITWGERWEECEMTKQHLWASMSITAMATSFCNCPIAVMSMSFLQGSLF